ncbi:MAG: hypothetical protein JAZ11_20175 [Candidatus Thiodiazotropha lotti]|nr:hypothetical protein [Candidatus Thiodiazotropha lotti]MCG7984616.1 hypothetical protein [Candidatus Thiodiazotropha lotti]ODC02005.1 hypothetical protein A3197_21630 [Candidatus Thiodiazotropha endoloripes]
MHMEVDKLQTFEKVHMWLFGIALSALSFFYGVYALIQGSITLLGRGNPPIGTFVSFQGIEARFLSTIFVGAGIWLFAAFFLGKRNKPNTALSWLGASTLLFGMCSLVVILCLPFFQQ